MDAVMNDDAKNDVSSRTPLKEAEIAGAVKPTPMPRVRPPSAGAALPSVQARSVVNAKVLAQPGKAKVIADRKPPAPAPGALEGRIQQPTQHASRFVISDEALHLNAVSLMRNQRKKFLLKIFVFVVLPTLLASYYTLVYSSPRYVSEFQIGYKSNDPSNSGSSSGLLSGITSLIGGSSASASMDMTQVFGSLIASQTMMERVEKKVDLRKMFSASSVDYLDRMPVNAPAEKFFSYFQRRVSVSEEETGGYVIVDVEAFTPEDARRFADAIIEVTESVVSEMNDRSKNDMVVFTRNEVRKYQETLSVATKDITDFREKYNDYNFSTTVGLLGGVVGTLQGQLASTKAELEQVRTFMGEEAPTVKVLTASVKALESQIQAEQNRLASTTPGAASTTPGVASAAVGRKEPYSQVMARYLELQQAQDFARQSYVTAEQAYEQARLDAARKSAYVVTFVTPNLPEYPIEPSFIRYVSIVFGGSILLYLFGSVAVGMLKDQAGI
jgi:capsular polysaccharide transport system permease protein